jgi:hypothetical protein
LTLPFIEGKVVWEPHPCSNLHKEWRLVSTVSHRCRDLACASIFFRTLPSGGGPSEENSKKIQKIQKIQKNSKIQENQKIQENSKNSKKFQKIQNNSNNSGKLIENPNNSRKLNTAHEKSRKFRKLKIIQGNS